MICQYHDAVSQQHMHSNAYHMHVSSQHLNRFNSIHSTLIQVRDHQAGAHLHQEVVAQECSFQQEEVLRFIERLQGSCDSVSAMDFRQKRYMIRNNVNKTAASTLQINFLTSAFFTLQKPFSESSDLQCDLARAPPCPPPDLPCQVWPIEH